MNKVKVENKNSIGIKIIKGIAFSFIITLVCIFVFSIILTYTNISESVIPVVIIVLSIISILIGTILSMRRISKNGMINGATIGGIYVILLYLISSVLNTDFSMNVYTIVMIIGGIVAGVIGGIIAVNT